MKLSVLAAGAIFMMVGVNALKPSKLSQSAIQKSIQTIQSSNLAQRISSRPRGFILAQDDDDDDDDDDVDDIDKGDPEDIEVYKEDYSLTYYSMSDDEYEEAFEWFNESDLDSNLTLDTEEVIYAFSLQDVEITNCTAKFFVTLVDGFFGHQYRDWNMKIDEFDLLLAILNSSDEEKAYWYFKAFDENQDSQISPREWWENEEGFLFIPDSDLTFDDADTDGDAYIQIDEWLVFMGVDTSDDDDDDDEEEVIEEVEVDEAIEEVSSSVDEQEEEEEEDEEESVEVEEVVEEVEEVEEEILETEEEEEIEIDDGEEGDDDEDDSESSGILSAIGDAFQIAFASKL